MYKFLVLITTILVTACAMEPPVEKKKLEGEWDLVSAMRDGKITSTLQGAFMLFKADTLYTNILHEQAPSIIQKGTQKFTQLSPSFGEIYYDIETHTDSTLMLKTKIRGIDFRFNLKRK